MKSLIYSGQLPANVRCLVLLLFSGLCISSSAWAQAKTRKLPTTINHPGLNLYAPFVSFDGDAIVFISDNAEDYVLTPFYTWRETGSGWKDPVALPKNVYTRLNFLYGFTLSADGKTMYLSTMKSPGVGGFDIWVSELKGTAWTEPKNLAAPVNSRANEASATVTPDGKTLYFMRCEKMDQKTAVACKIFTARKKPNGQWEEPVELPAHINTGNSQAPRIMADGETLLFSSDKIPGGKGGMDLYMSRFSNGQWTKPVPMAFANTDKDDQHVSTTALARYLLRDSPGQRKNELVEYLIPDELRPKGLMKLEGKVTDPSGTPIASYISVLDLTTRKRIFNGRPEKDGAFTLYLPEGTKYELSVDPEQGNISYYSKQFDLTSGNIPQIEKISVTLKPLADKDEIPLDLVSFKPYSAELNSSSHEDLKRLARVIKNNPALRFEIQVMMSGYQEDSVRSNPDLTEVSYDSMDWVVEDTNALGETVMRDTVVTMITYHNDRTMKQAEAIKNYLVREGVAEVNLSFLVNARPEAIVENRKVVVRVAVFTKR